MPYTVKKGQGCPESKPYAVVKTATGEVVACHATAASAGAQIGAINHSEKEKKEKKDKDEAAAWSERMRAVLEGCRPTFGLALAKLGDYELIVEVAASTYEKSIGLKWAKELKHDGMLFPYDTDHDMLASFTMSEVFVDLDILWFNGDKELIGVTENAEALSGHVTPPVPYRYVLEVPAGSVDVPIGCILDF